MDVVTLEERIVAARRGLPGLIELHFGPNDPHMYEGKCGSPNGNTHALVSRHEKAHYLQVYQKHPRHTALACYIYSFAVRAPTAVDFHASP
ncbi:hypothetical protein LSM04_008389 [Trypanosoma melophagium]|uniref:uncharacterized protein n=1 Tax=Trypanosoma melophagium TaxID=715481 RepID=UPI00351A74AC|nr:hypothetical protein LSM04_008389 [Trypanosoma melophagium]